MARALVTGVSGQDGWYLADLLAAEGTVVYGLIGRDDTAETHPAVIPIPGDMRDASSLIAALEDADPDEIYNLASVSSVGESWRQPELVADVNGVGVVRLLAAVRETAAADKQIRIVQAGSAEIFGVAPAPQNEATAIDPVNPYGAAKAFAQHAVHAYRAAGLFVGSAILFNHESPRRPPHFVTRKITSAVAAIAAGGADELVLGNLDARRDWGYARDYVRAMVQIARHDEPDDFVIATGTAHTVADFAAAAFAAVGITDWEHYVRVDPALVRDGDASEQRGNAGKARSVLGWEPTVGFEDLVSLMMAAEQA